MIFNPKRFNIHKEGSVSKDREREAVIGCLAQGVEIFLKASDQ